MHYNREQIAADLEQYNRTHAKRKNVLNICNARHNWNGCAYVDYHKAQYSEYGRECWKQDGSHKCTRCQEVKTLW